MDVGSRRLFVMRHCESLEDTDKTAYERIADEDMPLTERGKEQAASFGARFAQDLGLRESLHLILSPSKRVLQTGEIIVTSLPRYIKWSLHTESLIVKQNWGSVTNHNRSEIERERYRIGVLRYTFPDGESGAELLSRFGLFAKRLERDMLDSSIQDVLVITHGFELRVLLKSLLGWSEDYFETLAHPRHCEVKRVVYDNGSFLLLDEMRVHDLRKNPNFVRRQTN